MSSQLNIILDDWDPRRDWVTRVWHHEQIDRWSLEYIDMIEQEIIIETRNTIDYLVRKGTISHERW